MYEQYHPIGIVGIISAFNFPVAVWNWNTALAWVCGDVCVWKPSEKTPLTALACQQITKEVFEANDVPEGVSGLVIGGADIGKLMSNDTRVPLVSATGSTRMGKSVSAAVGARLGTSLLELGGNNAIIITPSADLKMVVPGAVFGAVGTAGQRCTSTRRLIIHASVYDKVRDALVNAYKQLRIGDPLDQNNHVGPLIDTDAVDMYLKAIDAAKAEGGNVVVEGGVLEGPGYESGCYVKPAIVEAENSFAIVQHETFAPILYLTKYDGNEPPRLPAPYRVLVEDFNKDGIDDAFIGSFGIPTMLENNTNAWLLDSYVKGSLGGTGEKFNWNLALEAKRLGTPIILAGGLTSDNVRDAINQVDPFCLDVSSGVESAPGIKEASKMTKLITNAKGSSIRKGLWS